MSASRDTITIAQRLGCRKDTVVHIPRLQRNGGVRALVTAVQLAKNKSDQCTPSRLLLKVIMSGQRREPSLHHIKITFHRAYLLKCNEYSQFRDSRALELLDLLLLTTFESE